MDTDSFIIHIKTEDVYEDIENDFETRFDKSNYEINRPLLTRKNRKVIGLMKGKLEGKIMTEFVAFSSKTYSYLIDYSNSDNNANGTKNL